MKRKKIDVGKERLDKNLNLLVKSFFAVAVALVLSKILAYVYRIVIARYFGPEVYGLFSLALMISGLVIAVASLGLVQGMTRYMAYYRGRNEKNKIHYVYDFTIKIFFVSSLIFSVLLYFLAGTIANELFNEPGLTFFLKVFSFVVFFTGISSTYLTSIRVYERTGLHSFISGVVHNLVSLIALALLILMGFEARGVAFSYLAGTIGMTLVAFVVAKYYFAPKFFGRGINEKNKKIVKKELLTYSMPLLLSRVVGILFVWLDTFSLGYFKTATEVGFYNAAVPIAGLILFSPEIFMKLFFPLINKEYSRKRMDLIKELSKQVTKWIFIINLPLFILFVLFPGAALKILFGVDYLVAENALRILSFSSLILSTFGFVSHRLVLMTGKSKVVLYTTLIASLFNLYMNYLLIPMEKIGFIENSTGMAGAAIATLLSSVLFSVMFMVQGYRETKIIPVRRKMLGITIVGIVSISMMIFMKGFFDVGYLSVILLSLLFLLIYTFLILITGSLDKNDFYVLKGIRKKALFKDR
jgi:O-antigen/teichoic acid export membrane protein